MTYSVHVTERGKTATKEKTRRELGKTMLTDYSPEHAKDFMLVAEATERAIDVLGGDSERDMIDVSVSGSISQTQETPDSRIVRGVSVKIYVTSTPTPVVPPLPELIEQSR